MRALVVIAIVCAGAAPARADRCDDGATTLAKHDLPHAALYLDGCDDAQPKAVREVKKQLARSDLSVLEIVSRPAGLDAEIDALPGEHLTTPATVYVAAGTHKVRAGTLTNTVDTKAHARSVVYLDAGSDKPKPPPKDGTADFTDEAPTDTGETGPPPAVAHRPMMPCKFTNSCTEAGESIDDPLALDHTAPPRFPTHFLELRAGTAYANAVEPALGVAITWRLQHSDTPWFYAGHGFWTRRADGTNETAVTHALEKVLVATDTAWFSAGAGATYDTYEGIDATALLDLALRRLPISVGAAYQQSFTAPRDHVVLVELGVGLRVDRWGR